MYVCSEIQLINKTSYYFFLQIIYKQTRLQYELI